jgi:hypothetical protein
MGINKKGAALALVIIAFMILIGLGSSSEMDRGSADSAGSSIDQYIHSALPPKPTLDNYYKDNMDMQLDCKKASKDLQEFYDCMNNP